MTGRVVECAAWVNAGVGGQAGGDWVRVRMALSPHARRGGPYACEGLHIGGRCTIKDMHSKDTFSSQSYACASHARRVAVLGSWPVAMPTNA